MMTHGGDSNLYSRFVRALGDDVGDTRLDFEAVENRLFDRIRRSSALGALASLQQTQQVPRSFWERMESSLFRRIQLYQEYDQPVDEALAEPERVEDSQWKRIGRGLSRDLQRLGDLADWEKALQSENPLSPGRWEAIEDGVNRRLQRREKVEGLTPARFWLTPGLFLTPKFLAASTAALALAAAAFFWLADSRAHGGHLETLVYRTEGTGQATDMEVASGAPIRAPDNGSLTLVNARGSVELRNGSTVSIERADAGSVRYRIPAPSREREAGGKVLFLVHRRTGSEQFEVSTPDYNIQVTGTYFQVHPDVTGRLTTQVLEGSVAVESQRYGSYRLEAGEALAYDPALDAYVVQKGLLSIPREEIEPPPEVETLKAWELLSITTDVPRAEVRINGVYRGTTPLYILLPPGAVQVWLGPGGYPAVDTTIHVSGETENELAVEFAAYAARAATRKSTSRGGEPEPKAGGRDIHEQVRNARVPNEREPGDGRAPGTPEAASGPDYYRMAEGTRDWKKAMEYYRLALQDSTLSPLRRQAAQFASAVLLAENSEADRAKARFLEYLALNPDGAFAGESWLRLAELEFKTNPDKSIEYYLKYFAKFPNHHRVFELQHRVGLIYLQRGQYERALAMFRQALANVVYDAPEEKRKIYASLHRALLAHGDEEAARRIEQTHLTADE